VIAGLDRGAVYPLPAILRASVRDAEEFSVDDTDARRAVARVGPTSGQRRRRRRTCPILRHAIDSANSAEKTLIHA
jgi:hypothetical protein